MRNFKKVVVVLLMLLIGIPSVGFGILYFKLNSMYDKGEANKIEKIDKLEQIEGITNVLLVGVDGENVDKGNRSDSMIILTLDKNNNDIRLSSLARDTYVKIPKRGNEKLTHAYAYEGPSLLIQTIKDNFGISIDKYVAVNFSSFTKIIDEIGGVQIDVTKDEVSQIPGVVNAGKQTLTGEQALAYSRIRYIDSAYQRDSRQRYVLESLYKKMAAVPKSEIFDIGNTMIRYTKTNMMPMEIMSIATEAFKINDEEFAQLEFPLEGYREGHVINDKTGWVIEWEEDYNKDALNNFVYDYPKYIKKFE